MKRNVRVNTYSVGLALCTWLSIDGYFKYIYIKIIFVPKSNADFLNHLIAFLVRHLMENGQYLWKSGSILTWYSAKKLQFFQRGVNFLEEHHQSFEALSQRPYVSSTPLRQWGFRQCLPFSWTTLRGKHCLHPMTVMGNVDTFEQHQILINYDHNTLLLMSIEWALIGKTLV